jgi:hypothetical protein
MNRKTRLTFFLMDLKTWLVVIMVLACGCAAVAGLLHSHLRQQQQQQEQDQLRRYKKQRVKELQADQKKWDEFRQ